MSDGVEIALAGVSHSFGRDADRVAVLEDLQLDLPVASYASIVGASGSGKSTLLSLLGGLESPQQGTVLIGGSSLGTMSRDELAHYRRSTVGFIFQHFGLLDTLSAVENVALARLLAGHNRIDARRSALTLLDRVGLADRASHRPGALSGGERQRVAVARALANEPDLVLADEPTGNLDEDSGHLVVELLETLPRERGCTVITVTHDRALAARAPHRFRLLAGRLVDAATP